MRALIAQSWEKVTTYQAANYNKKIITGLLNKDKWLNYPLKILSLKTAVN